MVKSKINSLFFNTLAPTRLLAIAASDCLKIIHFSSIAIQTSQIYIDAQIKKPPIGWFHYLVEAAGIEPASASPLPRVLHAYPDYCFSLQPPIRQESGK